MEEATENGKEWSHSVRASGMNQSINQFAGTVLHTHRQTDGGRYKEIL
jgi:hypothetical protein